LGTFSVSLDENYSRKAEKMRDKTYPDLSVEQAIKSFLRDSLDKAIPDGKVTK